MPSHCPGAAGGKCGCGQVRRLGHRAGRAGGPEESPHLIRFPIRCHLSKQRGCALQLRQLQPNASTPRHRGNDTSCLRLGPAQCLSPGSAATRAPRAPRLPCGREGGMPSLFPARPSSGRGELEVRAEAGVGETGSNAERGPEVASVMGAGPGLWRACWGRPPVPPPPSRSSALGTTPHCWRRVMQTRLGLLDSTWWSVKDVPPHPPHHAERWRVALHPLPAPHSMRHRW